MGKRTLLLAGIAATLAVGGLWHGPLGAGARLAARIEARSQQVAIDWDIPVVRARVATAPLRRTVILSGPANDFQRSEMVRLVSMVPGVAAATFDATGGNRSLPLALEAGLLALIGFAVGLIIAYLGELRRRSHQWDRF